MVDVRNVRRTALCTDLDHFFLHAILQPQGLDLEVSKLANSLPVSYASRRGAVDVECQLHFRETDEVKHSD